MPLSMERWAGKVAVVTGASVGIGAAIAEQLVEAGVKVIGLARRKEKIEELAKKLVTKKGKLYSLKCDVSNEKSIIDAFNWIEENVGPIQILVNNAGIIMDTNLIEGDTAKWKKLFDVNLWGVSIGSREAIKRMRKNNVEGHIININSVAGHKVIYLPVANVYSASKFALRALTATLRQELQFHKIKNIKLTNLSPGRVETELGSDIKAEGGPVVPDMGSIPLNAKEVADSVVYALSTPQRVEIEELIIQPLYEWF